MDSRPLTVDWPRTWSRASMTVCAPWPATGTVLATAVPEVDVVLPAVCVVGVRVPAGDRLPGVGVAGVELVDGVEVVATVDVDAVEAAGVVGTCVYQLTVIGTPLMVADFDSDSTDVSAVVDWLVDAVVVDSGSKSV